MTSNPYGFGPIRNSQLDAILGQSDIESLEELAFDLNQDRVKPATDAEIEALMLDF